MHKISWHTIDLSIAQKQVISKAELLTLTQKAAIKDSIHFNRLFTIARDYISYLIVTNNADSIKISTSLKTAIETATAIFTLANTPKGKSVQLTIANQQIEYTSNGITGSMDAVNWRYGFYIAIITGNFETVDFLCTIPTSILRASSTQSDEASYLFIDALQALWKKDSNALTLLEKAVEATHPKIVKLVADYVLNILVPEMELLWRFTTRDAQGFNKALHYALERYKKYWGSKEYKFSASGFIAYNLLAYTSLAYNNNMLIEVESDYLPKKFYQGIYSNAQL